MWKSCKNIIKKKCNILKSEQRGERYFLLIFQRTVPKEHFLQFLEPAKERRLGGSDTPSQHLRGEGRDHPPTTDLKTEVLPISPWGRPGHAAARARQGSAPPRPAAHRPSPQTRAPRRGGRRHGGCRVPFVAPPEIF